MMNNIQEKIINTLNALKGQDIVSIDLECHNTCYDVMILVSGRSSVHNIALANKVLRMFKCSGVMVDGVEGLRPGHWIVISSGSVVLHIFQKMVRDYYNIEALWQERKLLISAQE